MKQWKKMAGIAAAGALCCGVAVAQPPDGKRPGGPGGPGGRGPLVFEEADTNKDGSLSFDEMKAKRPGLEQERFDRWDKDKSGGLSAAEIPKRGPGGGGPDRRGPEGRGPDGPRPDGPGPEGRGPGGPGGPGERGPGDMMRRADVDKDGKVTLDEFKTAVLADAERRFKEMDRNSDGVLTPEDRPEGAGPDGPRGPGGPGGGDWEGMRKRIIENADADKDGKVTFEEMQVHKPGIPREAFDRMDGDKDGAITAEDPAPPAPPRRGPGRPDGPPPAE